MALTASQQWRLTTGGSSLNGGGFDPSLTTSMLTDGAATSATGSAPVFTSASYSFAAGDVGALLYVASGTNWTPGWYPIASVAGGAATLTAAIDSTLGGARKSDGNPLTATGCATTGSPTGATFSIDYSPLGTAIVSTTDLTSTNNVIVTSALTTFTPVMVGNILRLASGTGTTPAYYAIVSYQGGSPSQITLDRVSGTYTVGVSKIGGAFASLRTLCITNSNPAGSLPAITSPLAAGHIVNIKGSGSDDSSTVDYNETDLSTQQTYVFPSGTTTDGPVKFWGYNGRPVIGYGGLLFYAYVKSLWYLENLKGKQTASGYTTYGFFANQATGGSASKLNNIIVDQNGYDASVLETIGSISDVWIKNTGSTSAGTNAAIKAGYNVDGCIITGCLFTDIRGPVLSNTAGINGVFATVKLISNIVARCRASTAAIQLTTGAEYSNLLLSNTIDDCDGGGLKLTTANSCTNIFTAGNIFSNIAGTAVEFAVGTSALNDHRKGFCDYNTYYNNGTNLANKSLGLNDTTTIDPAYTNAAGNDFTPTNAALAGLGYPRAFRTGSTSYGYPGAVQPQRGPIGRNVQIGTTFIR